MTLLYHCDWNRQEILKRVGHMDQVAGIKLVEAADGLERGCRMLQAWTGSGLEFTLLADRALDISACRYKGIPLAWTSPVGVVHPAYYEPEGLGWLRSFPGGLLATCGLDSFGAPSSDAGEEFGLHGRISNLPARSLGYRAYWVEDNGDQTHYELEVTGEVRQTRVFGENLVLRRRISSRLGSNKIRIEDVEVGLANWNKLQPPTAGYREQVFRHALVADEEGKAHVELDNPALGIGLRWTYDRASLPHLFQWKMMGEGMYVLGIEPGNCSGVEGRAVARQRDDLPHLEPGESRSYTLEVKVIEYPQP
jgi:hypothetical protein